MAHILDFEIDGLAGRTESYSCKLDRTVNVFFGLNGSGKTSLLKILHSAMNNDTSLLRTVPFKSASVVIFSRDRNKTYSYSYEKAEDEESPEGDNVFDAI